MFLTLERHRDAVVDDAEQSQFGRRGVFALGEHDELGHERHGDELCVQVGSHAHRLARVLTVHQPESTQRTVAASDVNLLQNLQSTTVSMLIFTGRMLFLTPKRQQQSSESNHQSTEELIVFSYVSVFTITLQSTFIPAF